MLQAIPVVESENDPTTIEATGETSLPKFSLVAYTGGKVKTRDIPIPIVVEMTGIDIPKQKIPVRFEHKSAQGVGHTERIAVAAMELLAEGVISRDTMWARDVKKSAINGFPWQISMGGPIHDAEYIPFGQTVTVNGQTFEGELYVVRKMTLKEISFVDMGADSNTFAIVEAQFEEREPEVNEQTETKTEMPPVQMQADETVVSPPAPQMTPTPSAPPEAPRQIEAIGIDPTKAMQEFQQRMIIDQRRIAAIEKIGGGKMPDLEAKAIEEGWPVEKFHAEYQAKSMPDASRIPNAGSKGQSSGMKPTALEAMALMSSGSSLAYLEANYDAQTLDMADKYRGIGIQEFCELACGGQYLPRFRRDSRGWLEAAFSSASLPGILSNIANKVLLEGFLLMDDTWKKIVKTASVNNFQRHDRYRMNGQFKFEKVGPDGEIKHGHVGEEIYSQQVDTFAIMFGITRQMIINDDLSAFSETPRAIGIGAADAISDAVWGCVLANNKQSDGYPFFSTQHKNILTDAKAKLDINGLTEAEIKFSEQERSEGRPLGIPAKILLVPTSLKVAAETLMKSLTVNETTPENEPKPVVNPHAGKYEVVATPYLSSKVFTGNSASAWYLFADPLRLPAVEVAFLGGQDRPTVERADADFNKLGIQYRGYIDFGVREQDWRGALKMDP